MSDPLANLFGPTLRTSHRADPAPAPAPRHARPARPLPQIRSRKIDGHLFLRAEDVADALEAQAPTTNRRLIDRLRGWAR